MARHWTLEERRKQAEAIRRWKPWEQSTGPKSEKGKDITKMNALKSGHYARSNQDLRRAFLMHRLFRTYFNEWGAHYAQEQVLIDEAKARLLYMRLLRKQTINSKGTIKKPLNNKELEGR